MANLKEPAKPGHLAAKGDLLLKQTEETKRLLSKRARQQHSISKMTAVSLSWTPPKVKP